MESPRESDGRVPFTLLTGFLGAGKTTALNRLLTAKVPRRVAVLVNDLGRINIDRQLIASRDGDLLELSGGCVCCAVNVQRDLWAGILDLLARAAPEQLILETTGVAEPHVVLDRLGDQAEPRERVRVAGVIAVVDGEAGAATLAARGEARAQVQHAERVLLSKLDLASPAEVAEARAAVVALSPDAELCAFPQDGAGTELLARWLLEERPLSPKAAAWLERPSWGEDEAAPSPIGRRLHVLQQRAPEARAEHGQLSVVTFVDPAAMVPGAVLEVLSGLGETLVRAKGFLRVDGEARVFIEKAGAQPPRVAATDERGPRTELVLIGDGLDEYALHRRLWACRAERA